MKVMHMPRLMTAATTAIVLLAALAPRAEAQSRDTGQPPIAWLEAANLHGAGDDDRRAMRTFKGDSVIEGVLIGGAVAAVGGMIVAPYALCGSNDSECSVIVRVAVGLPILAGGLIVGGLVDKFHVQGPVVWRDESGRRTARIGTFRTGGAGVQFSLRFK
jgi:hypothetical protein